MMSVMGTFTSSASGLIPWPVQVLQVFNRFAEFKSFSEAQRGTSIGGRI
jgi:hypothetical protein